jgi:glutamyl-tRNA reductase
MRRAAPRIAAVGLSYRTAPVGHREKAALDGEAARRALRRLMSDPRVAEAAAVSTCNRTEVYVVSDAADDARAAAEEALVASSRISASELACADYVLYDEAAARHLFRVAGGLDSMVLGESEVQGQVKASARVAREEGALGPLLERMFALALTAGGRVRRETGICGGPTSVSSVAVAIAQRAFPDLASRRILLLGAGRMAASTGRALRRNGAREILVANRSVTSAEALAGALRGEALALSALSDELARADMVVCCTGAPHPIVDCEQVAIALEARSERPLLLIDLAVPRDVEPEVGSLRGALLHDIDDIERAIEENLDNRRRALADAEVIVADEVERFRARSQVRSLFAVRADTLRPQQHQRLRAAS